ncbi:RagB/SusD family nutrient uptake outer membrane protein [Pedobacter sp. ASV1-7]|uniref:RagB/SusD family nutrient uptake outer membrane protein n=1 Tax=Pedobacter sp. ASV1-7 TaxID=3145237 RepID=UPI0032E89158
MKSNYTIICLLILLSFSSCKKFLEPDPRDMLSPVNYYDTEQQMNNAIAGVYDILGRGQLYAYSLQTRLATEADEGFYASTSRTNGPQFYDLSSGDSEVLDFWTALYSGISRANAVLENINKPDMDETKRNAIHGEALFLRAYYHFLLVTNWGDVPLILSTAKSVEGNSVARTPAAQVYEQITKDMINAEALVPSITEVKIGGRVNKSAIRGILSRVYLYWAGYPLRNTAKYEDARNWAKKVMDDTEAAHDLNPSYSQVFINYAADKYDIKESIFEVEFATTGIYEHGQVGSWIGIRSSNADIGTAYGFIGASKKLYQLYKAGDLRRDRAVAPFYYNADGTKVYWTGTTFYGRSVGKWRREEETARPKLSQNTPINFALLRYSDVLLMFAEAESELNNGPTQACIDAVNKIRRRAWASGINTITITNQGAGYTSAPTVTISGGSGSGAVATAIITTGKVTGINLSPDPLTGVKLGSNYTSPPTISITGGGGTGATAVATIHQVSDADVLMMDKEDFLDLIKEERSRELCFEAMRKYDLIRWNILGITLNQMSNDIKSNAPDTYKYAGLSSSNFQPKNLVLPIPISEIALNKALVQTTGW